MTSTEASARAAGSGIVLVTGANGYIARALIRHLVGSGARVRATTRSTVPGGGTIDGAEVVAVGDLGPDADWSRVLEGVGCVIHLAGIAHIPHKADAASLDRYDRVNHQGSRRLFEAAARAGVARTLLVSSIRANGARSEGAPFTEQSVPAPVEAYGASKLAAERALADVAAGSAMQWAVLRPPLVYGPRAPGNMARLIKLVRTGLPLPLGRADGKRSYVGIDNLVSALVLVAAHPAAAGRTYLVSDGEDVSVADTIRLIGDICGRKPMLVPVPPGLLQGVARIARLGPVIDRLLEPMLIDSTAIRRELGWVPPRSLRDGLAAMVDDQRSRTRVPG